MFLLIYHETYYSSEFQIRSFVFRTVTVSLQRFRRKSKQTISLIKRSLVFFLMSNDETQVRAPKAERYCDTVSKSNKKKTGR